MWFIFHLDLLYTPLQRSRCQSGTSLILPPGDFPGKGGGVPLRNDMHDKYLIKTPKQYFILLIIERRTRWRGFRFDMVNSVGIWTY